MTTQITCKRCGGTFTRTERQTEYCSGCRKEKADPYDGWQEAMVNRMPCKKPRQRVHYPPHIVGGFR